MYGPGRRSSTPHPTLPRKRGRDKEESSLRRSHLRMHRVEQFLRARPLDARDVVLILEQHAESVRHGRGIERHDIEFGQRRRKNSRRKRGHRQEYTLVRVTEILTEGAKPTKGPRPKPVRKPKPDVAEGDAAQPD